MKHFKLSGKSTCALNDALEVLGMKKMHKMSSCPTKMVYLLSACSQAVAVLVPVCNNVLILLDTKKEARDYFLSPQSMFVMPILADLDPNFMKYFLNPLNIDDGLVTDVYRINADFINFQKFGISNAYKIS